MTPNFVVTDNVLMQICYHIELDMPYQHILLRKSSRHWVQWLINGCENRSIVGIRNKHWPGLVFSNKFKSNFYCLWTFSKVAWYYIVHTILHFAELQFWDCVIAVERLPALHYSVDFIFLPFGIMGFIVEFWNCQRVTDEAFMAETS